MNNKKQKMIWYLSDKAKNKIELELGKAYTEGWKDSKPEIDYWNIGFLTVCFWDNILPPKFVNIKKLISELIVEFDPKENDEDHKNCMIKWADFLESQAKRIRKAVLKK